jgi:hypothetical protein
MTHRDFFSHRTPLLIANCEQLIDFRARPVFSPLFFLTCHSYGSGKRDSFSSTEIMRVLLKENLERNQRVLRVL